LLIKSKKLTLIYCIIISLIFIICISIVIVAFFIKDENTLNQELEINNVQVVLKDLSNIKNEPINVILENRNETVEEIIEEKIEEQEKVTTEYKGFKTSGIIEIPKTGLNIPILSEVTVKGMEQAPCILYSTGELNKNGNNLIVGHNYQNGTIFSRNASLQIGDKIIVTSLDGMKIEYVIYNKFITTPEDVSYLIRDTNNLPEITLSSCTNDNISRIIILAKVGE